MRDPSKFTEKQKAYHERNKRSNRIGKCRICGGDTEWNEEKGKYDAFCSDACKKKHSEITAARIEDIYGIKNLANDPVYQRDVMLAGRKIARDYTFADGDVKIVLSKVEYDILEQLEKLGFASSDIDAPCKTIIRYKMDGKILNHIPDIYIKSLNLIISAKDSSLAPNKHPNFKKDRLKNLTIYKEILDNTKFNYAQIEGINEAKATKMIIDACKYTLGNKGRFIMPPRVDFVMYNESDTTIPSQEVGRVEYIILLKTQDGEPICFAFVDDIHSKKAWLKSTMPNGVSYKLYFNVYDLMKGNRCEMFMTSTLNSSDILAESDSSIHAIVRSLGCDFNSDMYSIEDILCWIRTNLISRNPFEVLEKVDSFDISELGGLDDE